MRKINEKLPIETWKEIAYHVQRLKFSDGGEEEFISNLQMLKKLLVNLDLKFVEGARAPKAPTEIGVSTLLQYIYNLFSQGFTNVFFYEQIYTLFDLGIQEVEFCPMNFDDNIMMYSYEACIQKEDSIFLSKAYTDGSFEFQKIYQKYFLNQKKYYLNDLKNVSYILNVVLEKKYPNDRLEFVKIKNAIAFLKDFKGQFPSKNEIMLFKFPNLVVPQQTIGFEENVHDLREEFECFDRGELSCRKRLTRDKNHVYYYEKEPRH